jgi:RIO kinase 2
MPISAEIVRSLHRYEIRLLHQLERQMRHYRWVPEDVLRKASGLSASEMDYRIGRLAEWGLLKSSSVPYKGYQLMFAGYDTLALLSLTKRGTVQALGCMIGEGKEAVVYEALGLGVVVLKFHRIGQRSFQSARLQRGYMPDDGHFPWVFASTRSARQEYEALQTLHPHVAVPMPIDQNRNVVAMSFVPGMTLSQCTLENPKEILDLIIENVKTAYGLGVIHGDLSEYNIMAGESGIWIIDWPQWIGPDHPNADVILRRDVQNTVTFFNRKYGISCTTEEVLSRVIG